MGVIIVPFCNKCGQELTEGDVFCNNCGAQVKSTEEVKTYICKECGQELKAGATFCNKCGTPVNAESSIKAETPINVGTVNSSKDTVVKKSNNKKIPIIIAIIVIALIGVVAFVLLSKPQRSAQEMIDLCKSQKPFVNEGNNMTIGEATSTYFGESTGWMSGKALDDFKASGDFGKKLSDADVIYFTGMAKADIEINDSIVKFCKEKGLDFSAVDGAMLYFGFTIDGDTVNYPFVLVDDMNNHQVQINDSGAKSLLFTIFTLVDHGITFNNPTTGVMNEYIIPNSDNVLLKENDIKNLSAMQLTYARNEIYARHGYVFESEELNSYFRAKSWYSPVTDNSRVKLNDTETANVKMIKSYQEAHGLTYTPQNNSNGTNGNVQSLSVPMIIKNTTDFDIYELHVSRGGELKYGKNLLTGVLRTGSSANVTITVYDDNVHIDIKCVDKAGRSIEFEAINLSNVSTNGGTITISKTSSGYLATAK